MRILIITSSYPSHRDDATSAAGLFVRDFALELVRRGHIVLVITAGRKKKYYADDGITILPLSWLGGDHELASLSFLNPLSWLVALHFLWNGCRKTAQISRTYAVERSLCMWIVPAGVLGWWAKRKTKAPYDAWALGSDVWKIRRIPFGAWIIKKIVRSSSNVYADGVRLQREVEAISSRNCRFLASSRRLPQPTPQLAPLEPEDRLHFLFVGRYHPNKGPDILIDAVAKLPLIVQQKIRIHMFGYGVLRDELDSRVRQLRLEGIVRIQDVIVAQELSNYLSRCHYVVIPSRIESIPVALSDAAQRTVPLIVSDAGDMGDLVGGYQAGLVFQNGNSKDLAETLAEAVRCDRSMFFNGIRSLSTKFDIGVTCKSWLDDIGFVDGKCT